MSINFKNDYYDYTPARLVKANLGWYIVWYDGYDSKGKPKRYRKSFGLGKIPNKRERAQHAQIHIDRINKDLAASLYRSKNSDSFDVNSIVSLEHAFQIALDIKLLTDRKRTRDCYNSTARIFLAYIHKKRIQNMPVHEFTRKHGIHYLDHIVQSRKIGPRTYNNYIINMKAIFYEIARREMISKLDNPFVDIPKRKCGKKIRRAFINKEVEVILKQVFGKDKYLALSIVLIYHCMIRPIESRRLRIRDIDLDQGIIKMSGSITKNKDDAIVTIPDIILPWFRNFGLDNYNRSYLIFGLGGQPHPTQPIGHNTINLRHKKILDKLHKAGQLDNIEGLSLYSWKDTGDQKLARSGVNILSIRDHNRHKSLATTNVYMQNSNLRDPEIAELDYTIIPQKYCPEPLDQAVPDK